MLNYRVIKRKHPKSEKEQYYASIVNFGKLDVDDLAERISGSCTVTRTDCLVVLSALQKEVIFALKSGNRVNLGDLGSMRITCNCKGADTKEDFSVDSVKKLNVIYLPSVEMKQELNLKKVQLNRVDLVDENAAAAASLEMGE